MKKRKKGNGSLLFGLVVAVLATVGYGASAGWFADEEGEALEGVPVRRGPLRISELSRGNLEAKNAARLLVKYEYGGTVIFLAEEGRNVEEGDLICELDVSELEDRRVTQEIEVKSAEASLTKSVEQYEIQEIQNQTDMDEAMLALELSKLDLEKFIDLGSLPDDYDPSVHEAPQEGEWAHELAQALESIQMAELTLAQDEETLKWTKVLHEKGFVQRTELDRDELAVAGSKIKVEQAVREYDLARQYGYRRKLAELQAEVQRRERDILKVGKQAVAHLAELEADRESDRYRLKRERESLAEYEEQLGNGKIFAPISGMLVYSQSKGSRWGGGEVPQEGGEVHNRQEIATIPRPGGMTVDVSLHETKLDNVRVGQKVMVKVDAIPGQVFEGSVDYVAAVADSGSWMSNPNQRLYKTEVSLTGYVPEMRPGMSCEIEILVEDLENILYVPRQAIRLDGGKTICFVSSGGGVETREVTVGLGNAKWTVIEEGLSEGDLVLLAPPPSWEPAEAVEEDPFPGGKTEAVTAAPAADSAKAQGVAGQGRAGRGEGARGDAGRGAGGRGAGGGEGNRGGGAAAGGMGNMSEEQRAELMKQFNAMSEEEKKAYVEKMRKQYGGGGQ